MIAEKLNVRILTPQREVYAAEVSSVRLPGIAGYFGIYPGHTPFVSVMKIGEIKVEIEGQENNFATSGGVVEVLPSGVSVLAETCESSAEIDNKRAEAARDRAKKRIEEGRKDWDVARAQVALTRAINRIHVAAK